MESRLQCLPSTPYSEPFCLAIPFRWGLGLELYPRLLDPFSSSTQFSESRLLAASPFPARLEARERRRSERGLALCGLLWAHLSGSPSAQ